MSDFAAATHWRMAAGTGLPDPLVLALPVSAANKAVERN